MILVFNFEESYQAKLWIRLPSNKIQTSHEASDIRFGSNWSKDSVWFWFRRKQRNPKTKQQTFLHVTSDSSVFETPQIPTISYQTQPSHHSDPRSRNHQR